MASLAAAAGSTALDTCPGHPNWQEHHGNNFSLSVGSGSNILGVHRNSGFS
jgi:hypothetical protein